MRVTTKGQVTIPIDIRKKLKITSASEVDFIEGEDGRIYLIKLENPANQTRFSKLRGVASTRMSTEEIMALTRSDT